MEETYSILAQRIQQKWSEAKDCGQRRLIIALAGPPGSGKSTIAKQVANLISRSQDGPTIIAISSDGFHLPLALLRESPNVTEMLKRRGAPWTFDAQAAVDLVRRLKENADKGPVSAPSFDHAIKDPVQGGIVVGPGVEVCIVEGNYVLSNEEPWKQISELVDDRWLVTVDPELARQRVTARHIAAGIEDTMAAALERADNNDMLNGQYIIEHSSGRYDIAVESIEEAS